MTICSMTGYATTSREFETGTVVLELKSVNSRFLDLQFRIHDDIRSIEPTLREQVMRHVSRGKIEYRVHLTRATRLKKNHALNEDTLTELALLQTKIQTHFPNARALSIGELLNWPNVIEDTHNQESLHEPIIAAAATLISDFISSRTREGNALKTMLITRVDALEKIVHHITPLIPEIIEQFRQKSILRLQEALGIATSTTMLSPYSKEDLLERIRQEVTLYGIRIDISEELSRLSAHLIEVRNILNKGGAVGKRLDFMMQELNREANTLGSKSASQELADAAMEMKLLIEQMREQVQNLE